MKFKTPQEEKEFEKVSVILQLILGDLDFLAHSLSKEITVTRILASVAGESGVHLDKRAIDVRDEHEGSRTFSPSEISFLLQAINLKWKRNDGFETMIHHQFQGGPWHLHIQIPSSTKVYEKQKSEGE